MSQSDLPAHPSLEQLRKRAKDLLRAARNSDPAAVARFRSVGITRDPLRLADAQFVTAREYGFDTWAELARHVGEKESGLAKPLIRPVEMRPSRPRTLADGTVVTTDDVYRMFVAARSGDVATVRELVARAPAIATVEYNYTPPIHFAVREGHLALTEFLVQHGADLAYRSYPFSDSLLMMAEEREHRDVASLLRRHLAERFALAEETAVIIDAAKTGDVARVRHELIYNPRLAQLSNETGDTALHQAAHQGHLKIVEALLENGAVVDAIRGDGSRPVHLALMPDWRAGVSPATSQSIANLLLGEGARNTMFIAAMRGDMAFIQESLERDRSLANELDTNHHRPISAAARRNDLAMVRLLLEHGADPSLPEEGAPRGHALWSAANNHHYELARLLLEHRADPNGMVESSGTPMMRAEDDAEMFALLRRYGGKADRNAREELAHLIGNRRYADVERLVRADPGLLEDPEAHWGDGILAGPASSGDHQMIELLMRYGARVPLVSKWAPYYYFKHEATAAFLLEQGMDPNHMNWHRFTLLHHMAATGEVNKARLLVKHGADVNAIDEEYRTTPLGVAARRGQMPMVKLLLLSGADPALAGAAWATPLAWARRSGNKEIAAVLDEVGAS